MVAGNDKYFNGGGYVLCQRTGFKVRRRDTVVESRTRLRVHRDYADPEHPQDHIRVKRDNQSFRGRVPEPPDVFLTTNQVKARDL